LDIEEKRKMETINEKWVDVQIKILKYANIVVADEENYFIHLQGKGLPINRDYGISADLKFETPTSSEDVKKLVEMYNKTKNIVPSLANTEVRYIPAKLMVNKEKIIELRVLDNDNQLHFILSSAKKPQINSLTEKIYLFYRIKSIVPKLSIISEEAGEEE